MHDDANQPVRDMAIHQKLLHLFSAFGRAAMLPVFVTLVGCASFDPALNQAIAEAERSPKIGRVKLLPFAEKGGSLAIAHSCIAWGRGLDGSSDNKTREKYFAWCRQAAETGHMDAQFYVGRLYEWGIGTPKSSEQALSWYRLAAGQGHAQAEDSRRAMEGLPAVCRNWITNCRMF